MSAAEEWARRQIAEDDAARWVTKRRWEREAEQSRKYKAMTFWQKVRHNIGFGS